MKDVIRVMIADDQEIVREGLKMILSLHKEIEFMGEAVDGEDLLLQVEQLRPDVVLMDIRMPKMNGIEATKWIKEQYPEVKIVILTTFTEDAYVFQGLQYGADGYLLKDSDSKSILAAIKGAMEGEVLLNPKVTAKVIHAFNACQADTANLRREVDREKQELLRSLTPREREVVRHVLLAKSNKEIADDLFVTEGTVKNYVSKILEKLEVGSRAELILLLQNVRV